MFDQLRYSIRLRRFQASKRRISAAYKKDFLKAKKEKKSRDEIDSLEHSEMFEIGMVDDEISQLESQILLRQAEKYRVPRPKDCWERSTTTGLHYLKPDAYTQLRRAIRQEKKEQWELKLLWIPAISALITALTGLLGIIVGLIAVIAK